MYVASFVGGFALFLAALAIELNAASDHRWKNSALLMWAGPGLAALAVALCGFAVSGSIGGGLLGAIIGMGLVWAIRVATPEFNVEKSPRPKIDLPTPDMTGMMVAAKAHQPYAAHVDPAEDVEADGHLLDVLLAVAESKSWVTLMAWTDDGQVEPVLYAKDVYGGMTTIEEVRPGTSRLTWDNNHKRAFSRDPAVRTNVYRRALEWMDIHDHNRVYGLDVAIAHEGRVELFSIERTSLGWDDGPAELLRELGGVELDDVEEEEEDTDAPDTA